ncbi:WSC domain-containing protein [Aspergillus novofumigatus IBT 16806]|uniref:Putative WSC domain protein n=1 Tax=Aspergillus novofumigatus (strain IBT 16806) TaxID=1392255 RepID=A0A2I1C2A0_ASPN1|nr:putative WSC domain protein [Aspergillus novofumigatus IBT 16806]PKX91723.1 putative WSC domain protein [Aspergillus novofumigatus IBT 16806]
MSPKILHLAFLSLMSLTPHVLASQDSSACYNSPGDLTLAESSKFMSRGMCESKCEKNAVLAVQGTDCYCGSSLPPSSAKVSNDKCDTPCPGYPVDYCGGSKTWTVMYDNYLLEEDSDDSTSTSLTVNPTLVATVAKDSANPTATIPAEILTAPSATFTTHPGVAHGVSSVTASSSAAAASKSAGVSSASASASPSTPSASPSGSAGSGATLSHSVGAAGPVMGAIFIPLVMSWF